ncbi:DUF945 family protein, partial [Escherichia coli]|uniref:DUF945 family protein n=1 Tax=Escherichia coli TaxID=562 RepID=UPI002A36D031
MIRKSATGVIVALAVIWGGGTWYTGTQIQPGVEKFIKDFNDAKKKGEHAYWICPYISRHLLSLNPLLACCRRYSRG